MICEKCGAQMQGTDCPKCGHHVELMGYSRELERLFNGGTGPLRGEPENDTPVPPKQDRREPLPPPPPPPPPEPPKRGHVLGLIASAAVLLAGVAILAAVLGNQSGNRAGQRQAEAAYGPQLEARYRDGWDDGLKAGIERTTGTYEAKLAEQYDAGKQAGIEQAEATYMPLILEQYIKGLEEGKNQAETVAPVQRDEDLSDSSDEPSPEPSPTPTPEPSPALIPGPTPSPEPEPSPTPEPSPEPSPSPEPEPSPTPAPELPAIATGTDLYEEEEPFPTLTTVLTDTIFPPAGEEPDRPADSLSLEDFLRDSWEALSPRLRIILRTPPSAEHI